MARHLPGRDRLGVASGGDPSRGGLVDGVQAVDGCRGVEMCGGFACAVLRHVEAHEPGRERRLADEPRVSPVPEELDDAPLLEGLGC